MTTVVPAGLDDAVEMAELLDELNRFYGGGAASDPVEERARQIATMVLGPHPAAHVLLAKQDERLVGLAAYSFLWPAVGLTHSLYLKELYVAQSARGTGVGRRLMEQLIAIAAEAGCSRVEWTADADNPAAVGFYEHLGYARSSGKHLYRLAL